MLNNCHREARLQTKKKTLYHATTAEFALAIEKKGKFLRGDNPDAYVGKAIYFAETAEDAKRKCHTEDINLVVFECEVFTIVKPKDKCLIKSKCVCFINNKIK